ncbi:hypothetical protein AGABI1DRAFT_112192 [Agaricus bisporus var. burnettii JB137-S8]|uniref:Uncharacterized protein n=1 Tax=Agaricus bisporus var. burnettii (strain JB137-S8 / ATCC MYA-4627 / FGSC 10392) TaxID=597362 RepID=K5W5B8_AGABU|nr:uncharacterized protein AGABI1DRAFT_112192 [Agaricus bisporus var. burnettii JB137-S8]EKM82014.1 hypothetical protein AGABI1DRAFT_112192 [Agaricus bisporus var. burnettii JB137-S8]
MLFYASVSTFVFVVLLVSYRYREMILAHAPKRLKDSFPRLQHYAPVSTFSQQANAGLTSSAFDIEANIQDGDSRVGLDEQGTQEVLDIMRRERVNFDQARLIRHNRILASNGIDASGMPLDSKAITRL